MKILNEPFIFLIKDDSNYSQDQIELKDVILGCIFTLVQSLSLFASIFFLIRMKKISKQCKKFYQEDHFQVSLQEEQRSSSPVQSTQPKQNQTKVVRTVEKEIKEIGTDNKQQIDFFENCSQYTDSVLSDIENSLPNKKKKALKSIDALQNTDSDAPNQKSQATKSERNNSHSHHHQAGKYMSIQKNDQIFEGEEEDEDEQEVSVHNKILTPGNGNSDFQQFRDKSLSATIKDKRKQKNTIESQSYYNTTIDIVNS